MAKITPMWLNDAMRGRADKTSRTYTKVDRRQDLRRDAAQPCVRQGFQQQPNQR